MGTEDSGDMRFQHRDGDGVLNGLSSSSNPLFDKVSGTMVGSSSMFKADPFCSGWDQLVSLSENENFEAHNSFPDPAFSVTLENQAIHSSSHLVHYRSDSGLGEMVPKLSCFGSGSYPEMVNSFGLADCGHTSYSLNKEGAEKGMLTGRHSQEDCRSPEDKNSPDRNKKRRASVSNSPLDSNKNEEEQHDPSAISLEQDEKKQKIKQNISLSSRSKQTGKQAKENSDSGDAAKENYFHMRAKRGQATNSHSLAERVRREKISERMRLLQELVPGCNKITGKAVMLDEIINYVQSLQQQVEFLSMKLATVIPDVNINIDRILSKDVTSRSSNAAILGYQGLRPAHPFEHGSLPGIISTTPYRSMPQTVWDNELHNLLQKRLDTNNNLMPTGRSKLDL